jgi:hypothetical protein
VTAPRYPEARALLADLDRERELGGAGALASARAHLARAQECGELAAGDAAAGLTARGVNLGAIQGQHVTMGQAAASVAIAELMGELVAELGRLRVAVEVLAGDALDRRAEALGGPYDQGDDGP